MSALPFSNRGKNQNGKTVWIPEERADVTTVQLHRDTGQNKSQIIK